jgi:hypothetical protein
MLGWGFEIIYEQILPYPFKFTVVNMPVTEFTKCISLLLS